jgi:DNA-binding NtrC family response regulator
LAAYLRRARSDARLRFTTSTLRSGWTPSRFADFGTAIRYSASLDFKAVTDTARLLVVDDDHAITDIYREVLTREGFAVVTAPNCAEAMQRMDEHKGDLQVLLVDLGLPDGDGADFVRSAAAKYGPRPSLYISGWTDEFWQLDDAPGRWLIMRKPVPIRQLVAAVKWLAYGGDRPKELDESPPQP